MNADSPPDKADCEVGVGQRLYFLPGDLEKNTVQAIFLPAKRKRSFQFSLFSITCVIENGGTPLSRTGISIFSRRPPDFRRRAFWSISLRSLLEGIEKLGFLAVCAQPGRIAI